MSDRDTLALSAESGSLWVCFTEAKNTGLMISPDIFLHWEDVAPGL